MFEKNYVKNKDIDILSTLLKYMKSIYQENALKTLSELEKNNFITTLVIINSNIISEMENEKLSNDNNESEDENNYEKMNEKENNPDKDYLENEIINDIKDEYIKLFRKNLLAKEENVNNNNSICILYKIPGLYMLYSDINKYIEKEIKDKFYKNEKEFRKKIGKSKKIDEVIEKFHENEKKYLDIMYGDFKANDLFSFILNEKEKINDDEKFIDFLNLLLKDYITFFY